MHNSFTTHNFVTHTHTTLLHTFFSHTTRNPFTHNIVTHTQLFHTQLFHTQHCHTHAALWHTTLSHTTLLHTTLSHTNLSRTQPFHAQLFHIFYAQLCHTHLSSTMSFILPAFPILFSHSFRAYWKKLTCGVIWSFNFSVSLYFPFGNIFDTVKDMNVCGDVSQPTFFLRSGVLHQGRGCNCKERQTLSRTAGEGVICHLSLQMHGSEWVTQQLFDMAWGIMGPCHCCEQLRQCPDHDSLNRSFANRRLVWFSYRSYVRWSQQLGLSCSDMQRPITPALARKMSSSNHHCQSGREKQSIRWEWATSPKCSSDQLETSDTR